MTDNRSICSGQSLTVGQSLASPTDGQYVLTLESNGTLCLTDICITPPTQIWSSPPPNFILNLSEPIVCTMESDGDLIVQNGSNIIWSTGIPTPKAHGACLCVEDD